MDPERSGTRPGSNPSTEPRSTTADSGRCPPNRAPFWNTSTGIPNRHNRPQKRPPGPRSGLASRPPGLPSEAGGLRRDPADDFDHPRLPEGSPAAATSCTASPARSSAAQPNRQGSAERDESLIWARISHFPSWRNRLASVHWAKPSGVWGWRPGGSPKPRSRAVFRSPRQTLPQPTREGAREAGRGRVVY